MEWFPVLFVAWSALLALGCLVELGFYYHDKRLGKWTKVSRKIRKLQKLNLIILWIPPLPFLVLSLVLMLSELSSIRASQPRQGLDLRSTTEDNQESVNADIAGAGIRYALLMQAGVLALAVLLGLFHKNKTGVKELGISILVFLSYLTFNLWYSYSDLIWIERLVTCMQVDALSAALSMTYSDKETLASRWFILCAVLCQCVAWSSVGYVTSTLPTSIGPFTFRVFWGVEFENRQSVPKAFWLYFSLRVLDELHNSWLALSWTALFNEAEHDCRAEIEHRMDEADPTSGRHQVDQNSNISVLILHELYVSRPATVFTKCIPQMMFSIVPLVAIEMLIAQCENVKGTREWGQRAAVIPPALGIMHWVYVQGKHIYQTKRHFLTIEKYNGIVDGFHKVDQFRTDPHLKQTSEDFLKSFLPITANVETANYMDTNRSMDRIHDSIKKAIILSDEMLRLSIRIGDLAGARAAIHGGAPLNSQVARNRSYVTPLSQAIEAGRFEIVEALRAPLRGDSGSEPVYSTPMVLAAKLGLENLSERADITVRDYVDWMNEKMLRGQEPFLELDMKILMMFSTHFLATTGLHHPLTYALLGDNKARILETIAQSEDVTRCINLDKGGRTVLDTLERIKLGERWSAWTSNDIAEVERLLRAHGAKTSKEIILEKMGRQSPATVRRRRGVNLQPFEIEEG